MMRRGERETIRRPEGWQSDSDEDESEQDSTGEESLDEGE